MVIGDTSHFDTWNEASCSSWSRRAMDDTKAGLAFTEFIYSLAQDDSSPEIVKISVAIHKSAIDTWGEFETSGLHQAPFAASVTAALDQGDDDDMPPPPGIPNSKATRCRVVGRIKPDPVDL
jgi:hypothetical protein